MALYERLCGRNEQGIADENLIGISVDQFSAMLIEFTYGAVDKPQIVAEFGLDAGEQAELDVILAKGSNQADRRELYNRIGSMLHLAQGNATGYGLPSQLKAIVEGI